MVAPANGLRITIHTASLSSVIAPHYSPIAFFLFSASLTQVSLKVVQSLEYIVAIFSLDLTIRSFHSPDLELRLAR